MKILGIETSCDETAIAIVSDKDGQFVIEKSVLSSQAELHAKWGGVVPEVAAREHAAHVMPLLEAAGVSPNGEGIDAIAVTAGPGLVPALRIGVELAKTLAWVWNKPLVAVNHLEGHVYSSWFQREELPELPALCLLVSGGHTELVLMKAPGQYELLGMTRDDAAGEAFDKVAKLMGLPYPGGPQISRKAKEGNPEAIAFPRPMLKSGDLDMSFSGLKTAVRVYLSENPHAPIPDVAASFQKAVIDVIVAKTKKAIETSGAKSLVLGGGVSADWLLRKSLQTGDLGVPVFIPELSLTGDNAAMIALAGFMRAKQEEFVDPLTLVANPNMRLD